MYILVSCLFFHLCLLSSFFNFDYFSATVAIVCHLDSICQKDSSKEVFIKLTYEEKKAHSLILFVFSIMNESNAWTHDFEK